MPAKKLKPEEELAILFPDEFYQTKAGQKIEVVSFPFGFWRKAIAIFNRHSELILGAMGGQDIAGLLLEDDGAVFDDLAELALGACPGFSREDLDQLPGNEAILLFFKVIKVNADFFSKAMAQGMNAVSGQSSPDSSSQAIAGTTSEVTP